jgi:hypothetical protein
MAPWPQCNSLGILKRQKKLVTRVSCLCRSIFIGNGVGLRPLREIIQSDQEVTVSLVTPWEGSCYIDGYTFERGPNIVLAHVAPILGPGAATCCTDVTL